LILQLQHCHIELLKQETKKVNPVEACAMPKISLSLMTIFDLRSSSSFPAVIMLFLIFDQSFSESFQAAPRKAQKATVQAQPRATGFQR